MTLKQKEVRRQKLTTKRLRQNRETITESHTLKHGQKCYKGGWVFTHRHSPVPGLTYKTNPRYRSYPVKAAVLRNLGNTEEDIPIARKTKRDTLMLRGLAPYEAVGYRDPERSWKRHRKTRWKSPTKNQKNH